jgi:hypothetical protein
MSSPNRRVRRLRSGLAPALGALVALAVAAAAVAAVPGLEQVRVTDPDVPDSLDHKVTAAPCPDGKAVLGAGGATDGEPGQHAITALVPDGGGQDLRQVNAVADEDPQGDNARWSLTAVAICADPPEGLELVEEDGVASSEDKTTVASCPAGKQVVGAGANIDRNGSGPPLRDVAIDDMTPTADLTSVSVTGLEDQDGTDAVWRITAYAICADPLPGLIRESEPSRTDSRNKSAVARCDDGLEVVGVGGDITGGKGQVRMQAIDPHEDRGGVTVVAVEDRDGTAARWTVRARAICATP